MGVPYISPVLLSNVRPEGNVQLIVCSGLVPLDVSIGIILTYSFCVKL